MRLIGNLRVAGMAWLAIGLNGCSGGANELGELQAGLIRPDHCSVRGTGSLPSGDSADADVLGDAGVTGTLTHVASDGSVLEGIPDFVFCRRDGSVIGDVAAPPPTAPPSSC